MKINKLIKQYGQYGNEYNKEEIGDTLNALLDALRPGQTIEIVEEITQNISKDIKPDQTPSNHIPVEVKEEKVVTVNQEGGTVVRSASSGDRVYYVKEGKKRWVKNPDTLSKLGFEFRDVVSITNEEIDKYETEDELDLTEEGIKKAEDEKIKEKEVVKNEWEKYKF